MTTSPDDTNPNAGDFPVISFCSATMLIAEGVLIIAGQLHMAFGLALGYAVGLTVCFVKFKCQGAL